MEHLVEMKNMTMKFPGVIALNNVSFDLRPGEVHILLGENGAGKSTLVKMLSGINKPTSGEIILNGKTYDHLTPKDSMENKIAIIYQELSVVNELSIAENLFVGKLPKKTVAGIKVVDYKKMNAEAEKYMKEIGLNRSPSTLVQDISISEKQQVEIAKALASQAKIIIMDEPTSSLSIEETEDLFKIIEKLKKNGIGIIYISHKLKELKQIGDRVTVLKDGCYVNTVNVADIEVEDMIPMMVGRKIKSVYPGKSKAYDENEIAFEVKHLTRKDGTAKDISFQVHKGENPWICRIDRSRKIGMYGGNLRSKTDQLGRNLLAWKEAGDQGYLQGPETGNRDGNREPKRDWILPELRDLERDLRHSQPEKVQDGRLHRISQ